MEPKSNNLILNVILPSLFFAGYLIAKSRAPQNTAQIVEEKKTNSTLPESTPTDQTQATSTDQTSANTASSDNPKSAASSKPLTYSTPSAEVIQKLGDKSWTQGTVQAREVDEKTGEINTTETLPDGSSASRTYRPDGSLKNEAVTTPDGTNTSRSFFENGNVKVGYVKTTDGSATSIMYDSTGFITQKTTEFPDQSRLYSDYDDRGTTSTTWRVYPDGRTEAYEPGNEPTSSQH